MSMMETSDLQMRVARYETAVEELRAAHQEIRAVLQDQVLYARWQQIGADLGFVPGADTVVQHPAVASQQLADSWAS